MSLGITEIVLIMVVALLLFGPKKIPELAKALGKASHEFKKAKEEIAKESNELMMAAEEKAKKENQTDANDREQC